MTAVTAPPAATPGLWPVAALLTNSMIWGLSWWPLRQLQAAGLHPLWSTVIIFAMAVAAIGPAGGLARTGQPPGAVGHPGGCRHHQRLLQLGRNGR
jgi:hypothetical protein